MAKATKPKSNLYSSVYNVLRMKIGFGKPITPNDIDWAVFCSSSRQIPAGLDTERLLREMVQLGYLHSNPDIKRPADYFLLREEDSIVPRTRSKSYANDCGLGIAYDVIRRRIGFGSLMTVESIHQAFQSGDTGIRFPCSIEDVVGDLARYRFLQEAQPGKYLLLASPSSRKPVTRAVA